MLIVLVAPMVGCRANRNRQKPCDPPPQVFNTPHHQSPVRADPDDLLLIPGDGFKEGAVVVYRLLFNLNSGIGPPPIPPPQNNVVIGRLDIVDLPGATPDGYNNLPDSLATRLPKVMSKGRSYALWVKNPGSCWSEPILINDARPLWLTPDLAYETTHLASLPRELKVVGRNLAPMRIKNTLVRLSGPFTYTLLAVSAGMDHALNHYVAKVNLPQARPDP